MLPSIGAVNKSKIEAKVKIILNQKSDTPLSTTNYCEKYKAKTITLIEFAKS